MTADKEKDKQRARVALADILSMEKRLSEDFWSQGFVRLVVFRLFRVFTRRLSSCQSKQCTLEVDSADFV